MFLRLTGPFLGKTISLTGICLAKTLERTLFANRKDEKSFRRRKRNYRDHRLGGDSFDYDIIYQSWINEIVPFERTLSARYLRDRDSSTYPVCCNTCFRLLHELCFAGNRLADNKIAYSPCRIDRRMCNRVWREVTRVRTRWSKRGRSGQRRKMEKLRRGKRVCEYGEERSRWVYVIARVTRLDCGWSGNNIRSGGRKSRRRRRRIRIRWKKRSRRERRKKMKRETMRSGGGG